MMKPFPRLNNYVDSATEKELKDYLPKLLEWCDSAEHILMGLEIVRKKCQVKLHCCECGENVWCFSDETLKIIQSFNSNSLDYQSTNKRRKQTMSDLRQLLNDSSLKEFTYDEQSFENKIDYAVDEVIKVFRRWLSGKLVAGSEKANPHNDVILKLLHELKEKEVEQK